MNKVLLLLTSLLFFCEEALPQVTEQWVQRYDFGGTSDKGKAITIDSAANVYVTGTGGALGNTDIITIKYDSAGQLVWTRVWNGPNNSYDGANAIVLKDSSVYVTGYTEDTPQINSNRRRDFATLKYKLDGTFQWAAYYNNNSPSNWEDIAYALDVDDLGNVYVTGSSKSASHQVGYRDIAIVKYNSSGEQQWGRRYNALTSTGEAGTDDDIPVALKIDLLANVYITGSSITDTTGIDYITLKYDSAGTQLWEKRYTMPGVYADVPVTLKLDDDANVYVTGTSSPYAINPAQWDDFATIKYTTDGDTVWVRRFNSGIGQVPIDEARDLAVDLEGNVYVTGSVPSLIPFPNEGPDFYTLKYDINGNLEWESRWIGSGASTDKPNKMKLDQDGNIYITGFTTSPNGTLSYATVKLDNNGDEQWFKTYQGPSATEHFAQDLVLDSAGNVYITGQSYGFNDDYVTIKYIEDIVTSFTYDDHIPVLALYPNPVLTQISISFTLDNMCHVYVSILNLAGEKVKNNPAKILPAGKNEIILDMGELNSGIYFCELRFKDQLQIIKVLKH